MRDGWVGLITGVMDDHMDGWFGQIHGWGYGNVIVSWRDTADGWMEDTWVDG